MYLRRCSIVVAAVAGLVFAGPVPSTSAAEMCDDVAPYCDPVDGTIHDGAGIGTLVQVPGDPSPGAPGIWLGHRSSARYCYANYNSFIVDADHDWLDDQCELDLARAFAPAMTINPLDSCPKGEPFWGAKYFANDPLYGWGEFVRIAYMPGYYRDCGSLGHDGDSEFIMLSVHYNGSTQHWEVREGYLSAHAGTPTDSSEYVRPGDGFDYPVRPLAYPNIWVAKSKHGNYKSHGACNAGALSTDTCNGNVTYGRLRVYKHRNVGSRFLDKFPTGVLSENPLYRPNGSREYFYTQQKFRGWQLGATGVTPYYNFIYSQVYECFDPTYTFQGGNCYPGPGPNPPASTKMTGVIDGVAQVIRGQSYTWTTFVTGGGLPYRAQWWRRYASEPTPTLVGASNGSGPFDAGSWTGIVDRCENFTLTVKVISTDNQVWYDDHAVAVTSCPPPPPPPLSVSIDGPGAITVKGTYTYTAVTSGYSGPTYTWSERFCDDYAAASCSPWTTITGLGSTFNRTLSPDCSGTGEHNFQVSVLVRNSDGRTASANQTTYLCGAA